MSKFKWKNKSTIYKMKGDKIEVRIMNEDYHVYYKKAVGINDEKGKRALIKDLNNLGITFPKQTTGDWFE